MAKWSLFIRRKPYMIRIIGETRSRRMLAHGSEALFCGRGAVVMSPDCTEQANAGGIIEATRIQRSGVMRYH